MAWVKLHNEFPDHPKVAQAGWKAGWLYVCGLTYCGRFLTDGRIPKEQVKRLTDMPRADLEALRLVEAGLWEDHGNGHYIVHDYTVVQNTAAKVEEQRESGRKRAAASHEARAKNNRSFATSSPEDVLPEVRSKKEEETSSSGSSCAAPLAEAMLEEEEEENLFAIEARRRLFARQGEPVNNPAAWVQATATRLRHEEWHPELAKPKAPPPKCSTCKDVALAEACEDCCQ